MKNIKLHEKIMTHLKVPLYYYDNNDYKIGPISKKELYALAEKGAISPETRTTDDNIEVKAKDIPKLKLKFYAPEYHQAEEIFCTENINLVALDITKQNKPKVAKNTNHTDYAPLLKKITRHPLVITTVALIAITALTSTVTCYILVSATIALTQHVEELQKMQEEQQFNIPEVKIHLPQND